RRAAIPRRGEGVAPKIHCELEGTHGSTSIVGSFIFHEQKWSREEPRRRSLIDHKTGLPASGSEREDMKLVIGAGPEGGCEVWDPDGTSGPWRLPLGAAAYGESRRFSLDPTAVWEGLTAEDGTTLCNGLIRDWVAWQFQKPTLFDLFARVLAKLSPHP